MKYVGRTSKNRLIERTGGRGQYYKANGRFYADIQKYGWENFTKEILSVCNTEEESMSQEIHYISLFDSTCPDKGYNKSVGGFPCNKGLSDEEKKQRKKDCIRRWKENNREKYLEFRRNYDRSEKRKAWANAFNKTEARRKHRAEYMRKYRAQNPEKIKEINRRSNERRKKRIKESDSS